MITYSNLWRLTWKHSLTALRSMEEALSICLDPCLKGSTLISFLCLSESSISFFLTHWIPRCWNSTVISSELTCKVHTPRLQPSFPTYNKCERIWIACWINKKVVSWRQKYSKKELNVLWMVKPNSFVSWCLMRIWTTYTCWTDKIVWMSSWNICIMRDAAYNYNRFLVGTNDLNLWVGLPLLTWMLTLQGSCPSSFTLVSEPQTVGLWLLNYSYEGFLNLFCLRWTNIPLKIQAWL